MLLFLLQGIVVFVFTIVDLSLKPFFIIFVAR